LRILNALLCGSWFETAACLAGTLLPVILSSDLVSIELLEGSVLAESLLLLLHVHALVSYILLVIQLVYLRLHSSG
jgi:hypothetical protein